MKSLKIISFGFKYTSNADIVNNNNVNHLLFDCRFIKNPYYEKHLSHLTGLDREVIDFLNNQPEIEHFLENCISSTTNLLFNSGINNTINVSFGCTGGQHRSVYCAQKFVKMLNESFPEITISIDHLDIHRSQSYNGSTYE